MTKNLDARTGITHIVAGMHIGPMGILDPASFDSVLTVAAIAGQVPDEIRHRHHPLPYTAVPDHFDLSNAVKWVHAQVQADRTVLVRSERGLQRPALVVALVILALGGRYSDATTCLYAARPEAFTDFRYRALLRAEDDRIDARLRENA